MTRDQNESDEFSMSDEEIMDIESGEENNVSEEEEIQTTKKQQKKHKKSYDPRFSVPTYEEKQMMRNADMEVELSLLEIEVSAFTGSLTKTHICVGSTVCWRFKCEACLWRKNFWISQIY